MKKVPVFCQKIKYHIKNELFLAWISSTIAYIFDKVFTIGQNIEYHIWAKLFLRDIHSTIEFLEDKPYDSRHIVDDVKSKLVSLLIDSTIDFFWKWTIIGFHNINMWS